MLDSGPYSLTLELEKQVEGEIIQILTDISHEEIRVSCNYYYYHYTTAAAAMTANITTAATTTTTRRRRLQVDARSFRF